MRTFILAGAIVAVLTTPAAACRGTSEYPEAANEIEQSTLTPFRKNELLDQLSIGNALHEEAHLTGDMMKMSESIRILDGIKSQVGK